MKTIIKNIIMETLYDPFKNTYLEGYTFLSPASRGKIGQIIVENFLRNKKFHVTRRTSSGHDIIVNNIKTEIKSIITIKSSTVNHISKNKDWERLIVLIIRADITPKLYFFTKESFVNNIDMFRFQQGGKSLNNDDYMIRFDIISDKEWVKTIDEWC
jgi:hypothetical protein